MQALTTRQYLVGVICLYNNLWCLIFILLTIIQLKSTYFCKNYEFDGFIYSLTQKYEYLIPTSSLQPDQIKTKCTESEGDQKP